MRPKFWVYPYRRGSQSVNRLIETLPRSRMILREGSRYRPVRGDVIINWGSYRLPPWVINIQRDGAHLLNRPDLVEVATSKMGTFRRLQGQPGIVIPEWTQDYEEARQWQGKVLGRDIDRGSEGQGITVYDQNPQPGHTFYTRYFKKAMEFRVHVMSGQVMDVQQKLRRDGVVAHPIRNTANGYIFGRQGIAPRDSVLTMAVRAVDLLGLDFGAVDIGWNNHLASPCIFEVNTAPGIEGTTVEIYAERFAQHG